ncbi:MAG: hypothetical protein SFV21_03225 [Rhodospirillaceae bacterium]|nr:hypothetical protein [Rhodospirillaceae bacterium]
MASIGALVGLGGLMWACAAAAQGPMAKAPTSEAAVTGATDVAIEARRADVIAEDLRFMLARLEVLGGGTGIELPVGPVGQDEADTIALLSAPADRAWAHAVALAVPSANSTSDPGLRANSLPGLYAVTVAGVGVVAGRDPDRVLAELARLLRTQARSAGS